MAPYSQDPSTAPSGSAPMPHWHSPTAERRSLVDGDGARVFDEAGNEYLDFLSQLYCVNVGHDNSAIRDAVDTQLERIPYVSSALHNDTRSELAEEILSVAPDGMDDIFFSVTGSEANEAAIQLARAYQDAPKILTRWRSYHGGTYAAAGLTGDPSTRAAVERYGSATGFAKFLPPLPHRSPFEFDSPEQLTDRAIEHLEFVIRNEGADSIAAILLEPVGGTSGAYPAPPGYFARVRELCDTYDILLVADEVITGFGRCGEWFGIQTEDVAVDMITFAKGVTSAYVPLGGVLCTGPIGEHFRSEGISVGQTFAGHPVSCAAGIAALNEYGDGLLENVRDLSPVLEDELSDLERRHPAIGSVHGRGFLWSVEFSDPDTGNPFFDPWVQEGDNPVAELRQYCAERGVLFGAGRPDTQFILAPPFCIDQGDVDEAISVLERGIEAVLE